MGLRVILWQKSLELELKSFWNTEDERFVLSVEAFAKDGTGVFQAIFWAFLGIKELATDCSSEIILSERNSLALL